MGITAIILGRALPALAVLGACGLAGVTGLELARSKAEGEIYRERLAALSEGYDALASRYNDAVRRAAVSELVVENGRLSVVVRTIHGELRRIDTPYDPSGEIYVDFALVGGRVWIRRVFDSRTPPASATVIDPTMAEIDWEEPGASYGKAVYRSLGEGRWVVTVTGSGALALERVPVGEGAVALELSPPPVVASFEEIEAEARARGDAVTWRDVMGRMVGMGRR